MNYPEFVRDFAARTQKNLDYIDKASRRKRKNPEPRVFEVTQLVNSMLGLLIFPQQEYMNRIPEIPLTELNRQGWPVIYPTHGKLPGNNLRQLVRYLRNSIAHGNLEFLPDSNTNEIIGLRVWNERRSGVKDWEAELNIKDMRELAVHFLKLLESELKVWS